MGFFTGETTWQQIAKALGVSGTYARQLKALMDSQSPPCGRCGADTNHSYMLRPADADHTFGKPSTSTRCKVLVQRLCVTCQGELGGLQGAYAYFKAQVEQGNALRVDFGKDESRAW